MAVDEFDSIFKLFVVADTIAGDEDEVDESFGEHDADEEDDDDGIGDEYSNLVIGVVRLTVAPRLISILISLLC